MLDSLLKNKFYNKCKSATKATKERIEIIKRKRNAMQKFLKNDVADLLKDGLAINAYGRAQGLLVELNLSSCYDIADKFCDQIIESISVMSKQKECPEECKEAVSSLIFAAARFADLPELRELRSIFTERYGNILDCYANKEFVQKLQLTHPTKDATIELMQHIATEAGLHWDSEATEEKLNNPVPFRKVRSNVDDKFQASEKHKDGEVSYKSNNRGKRKYSALSQEENRGRKEQETSSHIPDKKTNYNPIPPYTKSRIHNHRNNDEGKILLDSINDHEYTSKDGSTTTSGAEKVTSESQEKDIQQHEEETWSDRLLTYYSRKKTKLFNRLTNTESTKSPPKQEIHSRMRRRGAGWGFRSRRAALSLPTEQKIESEGTNNNRRTRSTSLPSELFKGGHVHPKLPNDYDDFLAHLSSIKKEESEQN